MCPQQHSPQSKQLITIITLRCLFVSQAPCMVRSTACISLMTVCWSRSGLVTYSIICRTFLSRLLITRSGSEICRRMIHDAMVATPHCIIDGEIGIWACNKMSIWVSDGVKIITLLYMYHEWQKIMAIIILLMERPLIIFIKMKGGKIILPKE